MSEFLNFLNTADINELTKTPGISQTIAEGLIAARPFEQVDDCLKVRGMGKALLARMQSTHDGISAAEESAQEEITAPKEISAPVVQAAPETPKETQPSFFARLWKAFVNFIRALLKFVLTLAFIGGIAAAVYFGVPYLNEKLIVPVEKNTASIRALEKQVTDLQSQLDETNTRVGAIEKAIESQSASIAKIEEMQAALEKENTEKNNSVMVALKREMMYTRAIETLSRARLYLSQSNFGLAQRDVQSTRDLLSALRKDAPAHQVAALDEMTTRLDLALKNLPDFPVIAADDVDIAWELMMIGLPEKK